MKFRLSIIFAFFGLVTQAQEELTLSKAVNYALHNKAEAVKARLEVENSEYMIAEARSNALPQISANGSLTYNAILQEMALNLGGETMVIRMGLPWQNQATVNLNQQIFNMAVFTGLKAAKSTREFYQINAQLTEEQVIEKVANAYYEVYKNKSQLKTLNQTIENTTRVRDVIKSLYDNGIATKIDLDRTNVALNNLKSSKQQLINGLELQENSLKYLIGMEMNTVIYLPDNTFEVTPQALATNEYDLSQRTEMRLLEQQNHLLNLNKKATEAQGYPTLSFTANYGYLGMGDTFPWGAGSAQGVSWSNFSAFGLNLSIPIFNGGQIRAKAKQAQVEIDRLEADIEDTRLALDLSYKNALTQMNNSLITLNMQQENMDLAEEVLTNIENNYKHGLATLTDLLDAENSNVDAQNNYTNALLDYKLAEIQLIKAKGELHSLKEE